MKRVRRIVGRSVALLFLGSATCAVNASQQKSVAAEFVGGTPCGEAVREFLGGLATNAPCHWIAWQITLLTNQSTGLPAAYNLVARYRIPADGNPNQSQDGPEVASQGRWEVLESASQRGAVVYRITEKRSQRSLSMVKVGENLLHLLSSDGSLAVGNGGWSYTLNRRDRAEKIVDATLAMNAPDMSYKISPLATGPSVFGVFEGRSPCRGMAEDLRIPVDIGCMKVKWRVTLFQNPDTAAPGTYKVEGSLHRQSAREGTWRIVQGANTDPNATVYQLNPTDTEPALLLLKGDDNVLFFLDRDREPRVGHAEFSYTLNRVGKTIPASALR